MEIRQRLEEEEKARLSKFAALSANSKDRERQEQECDLRTAFMRDRDRIIHCKAFRRLKHKTQVFFSPKGDHYRTRLTHTLEVAQISRTIARALKLNEDLTEAIALGHDLGHTPFGHIGEEALTATGKLDKPFNHNEQSLRVVEHLEYGGKGLNLTREVRDGILNHTGGKDPNTLEGKIVKISDRIAYVNHDIDDAIRAKLIEIKDLPKAPIELLGVYPSQRISALVHDMINSSMDKNEIIMSPPVRKALGELRDFLFANIYEESPAKSENEKAINVIQSLFNYFFENPAALPREYFLNDGHLARAVCDYISGMSDRYALAKFEQLFLPKSWAL
jgi:dGTPase